MIIPTYGRIFFDVSVDVSFRGTFRVEAATEEAAVTITKEHCSIVLAGGVHSSLPEGSVDWDFPIHPHAKHVTGVSEVAEDQT